jgi:hypothetical protein
MDRHITMRRLLAIFMIAGLVLAPLSRPVMAGAVLAGAVKDVSMSAMADDTSAAAMTDEMANDMPCCPSKAPTPIDCDKCVFMAACMTKCFAGLSATAFRPLFAASGRTTPLQNDFWPDGLGYPPPEHPPRTLV